MRLSKKRGRAGEAAAADATRGLPSHAGGGQWGSKYPGRTVPQWDLHGSCVSPGCPTRQKQAQPILIPLPLPAFTCAPQPASKRVNCPTRKTSTSQLLQARAYALSSRFRLHTSSAAKMVDPSPAELDDIKLAAQKLWTLDENRLKPGVDYAVNLQVGIV